MMTSLNSPELAALHDDVLRDIAAQGIVRKYPKHAVLIQEGDRGDALYIVLAGRVKVYASDDSGKEVIIDMVGAGEYVGEMVLDGGVRSASVMTMEPSVFAVVR